MKKLLALILVVMLIASLAACGGTSTKETEAAEAVDTTPTESADTGDVDDDKYDSIADYLNDPDVQDSINAEMEEDDGFKMDVYAEGDDTVVYKYTFSEHFDSDQIDALKELMEEEFDEDSFDEVIDEIKEYVNVSEPKVRVIYCNDDGTEISNMIFK